MVHATVISSRLLVRDISISCEFYTALFDFTPLGKLRLSQPEVEEIPFADATGHIALVLISGENIQVPSTPGRLQLVIAVPDITELARQVHDREYDIVGKLTLPQSESQSLEVLLIADPNGYIIEVVNEKILTSISQITTNITADLPHPAPHIHDWNKNFQSHKT